MRPVLASAPSGGRVVTTTADRVLAVAALLGAVLFFGTLSTTWPLADARVAAPAEDPVARAREVLQARGLSVDGFASSVHVDPAENLADYLVDVLGVAGARALHDEGYALVSHVVVFKAAGDPEVRRVQLHPDGRTVSWARQVQPDAPGASLEVDEARALAEDALTDVFGVDLATWTPLRTSTSEKLERRDHVFTWELRLSEEPDLRARASATVRGDVVAAGERELVLPAAAWRAAKASQAAPMALQTVGFGLVALAAVGAVAGFVVRLRDDALDLVRPARWVGGLFLLNLGFEVLRTPTLFGAWDPLWPWAVSVGRHLVMGQIDTAWVWLVLFALFAIAADEDRRLGADRAASLFDLGEGRWSSGDVGPGLLRGVALGFACGGVFAAIVAGVDAAGLATIHLQPRGFLLLTMNTALPALAIPLFLAKVAVVEELGYRVFGASWLLRLTGRPWVAVLLPALVYGLSHTGLDFLPPAEPAWGRALALTAVGAVWGVAYLRWGALTVVIAHVFADTFLFAWPMLASGATGPVATLLVPLGAPVVAALVAFGLRARAT